MAVEQRSDFDRFLEAVAPRVQSKGRKYGQMKLEDIWLCFQDMGHFGQEIYTIGGERGGPSWSYFVPYLSAIHLFLPGKEAGEANFSYKEPNGERYCHSGFLYYEVQEPYSRAPLYERIKQLSEAPDSRQAKDGSGPFLRYERLANIHPSSWVSIAWYPIYRIPEASVWGRFLTFHRMCPLFSLERDMLTQHATIHPPAHPLPGRPASAQAYTPHTPWHEGEDAERHADSANDFTLPAVGVLWYNTTKEKWFELLPDPLNQAVPPQGGRQPLGGLSPTFDGLDHLEQSAHYIAEQYMVEPLPEAPAERLDVHNSVQMDFTFFKDRHQTNKSQYQRILQS